MSSGRSIMISAAGLAAPFVVSKAFVPAGPLESQSALSANLRGVQPSIQVQSSAGGLASLPGAGFISASGAFAVAGLVIVGARNRASKTSRFAAEKNIETLIPTEQVGVTAPLGFFDPLGFSKGQTVAFADDSNGFMFLRSAEIKNGRVAMMASVGLVAQHYVKFPGFEDVPAGINALSSPMGANGFTALVCVVGLLEWGEYADGTFRTSMGNYGDPANLGQFTKEMRNKELNNCRMAMFAVLGQIVAEATTGLDAIQQFGL